LIFERGFVTGDYGSANSEVYLVSNNLNSFVLIVLGYELSGVLGAGVVNDVDLLYLGTNAS
jgi:hypothetical protein